MKYHVYGKVVGTKYLGEVEAASKEQAELLVNDKMHVSLCHHCSNECDDPEITEVTVEPAN